MTFILLALFATGVFLIFTGDKKDENKMTIEQFEHDKQVENARQAAQAGSVDFYQSAGNAGGDPPGFDRWREKYGIDYIPATVTFSEYMHDVGLD
jgi:hypothetical protein